MDITKMFTDPLYNGYQYAVRIFGKDNVAIAERIYILETAHYTSTQFLNGYSAGMVAFSKTYPYGWSTLQPYWDSRPIAKPNDLWSTTVGGQPFTYIVFPSFRTALMALCVRLQQDGWDPNKWNGDPTGKYGQAVNAIKNVYVV
jgi:hypothetical protein